MKGAMKNLANQRRRLVLTQRFWRVEGWLYGGDKEAPDIRCHSASAVVVRYPQKCCSPYHGLRPKRFPAGTLMVAERAVIDGSWRTCYTCEGCIEKSLVELSDDLH